MYKKYKRKNCIIKTPYIMIIIILISIVSSIGYSYWSTDLKIKGNVSMIYQEEPDDPDLPTEISKSTQVWKIANTWGKGTTEDPLFYQVKLSIENHDDDLDNWTVSFEVPKGIIPEKINAWIASSTTIEGNRITLVCQSWNGSVADGETLELEFQLAFDSEMEFFIKNVVINNRLIKETV